MKPTESIKLGSYILIDLFLFVIADLIPSFLLKISQSADAKL